VAYDAGIINAASTPHWHHRRGHLTDGRSVVALRAIEGWPLLSTNPDETWKLGEPKLGAELTVERA